MFNYQIQLLIKWVFERLKTENLGLMSLIYAAEEKPIDALKSQLSYQKSRFEII